MQNIFTFSFEKFLNLAASENGKDEYTDEYLEICETKLSPSTFGGYKMP